jgi:hypothetical protein
MISPRTRSLTQLGACQPSPHRTWRCSTSRTDAVIVTASPALGKRLISTSVAKPVPQAMSQV